MVKQLQLLPIVMQPGDRDNIIRCLSLSLPMVGAGGDLSPALNIIHQCQPHSHPHHPPQSSEDFTVKRTTLLINKKMMNMMMMLMILASLLPMMPGSKQTISYMMSPANTVSCR